MGVEGEASRAQVEDDVVAGDVLQRERVVVPLDLVRDTVDGGDNCGVRDGNHRLAVAGMVCVDVQGGDRDSPLGVEQVKVDREALAEMKPAVDRLKGAAMGAVAAA